MQTTGSRREVVITVIPDDGKRPVGLHFTSRQEIREHVAECMALIGALPGDGEASEIAWREPEPVAVDHRLSADGTQVLLSPPADDDGEPEPEGGPCAAVSPDGDPCTVTGAHHYHYGPDKGAGVRRMWEDEGDGTAPAACMTAGCGHGEDAHTKSVREPGIGVRLIGCRECDCNRYLSPRPGGAVHEDWCAGEHAGTGCQVVNRLSCGCTFLAPDPWPAGRPSWCDTHGNVTTAAAPAAGDGDLEDAAAQDDDVPGDPWLGHAPRETGAAS